METINSTAAVLANITAATAANLAARQSVEAAAIVRLPFGSMSQLAATLTAKGREQKVEVLVAALLPIVSNQASGAGTFHALVRKGAENKSCPLQVAVKALKGKPALARNAAFALAERARTQEEHDSIVAQARNAIEREMAVEPKEKKEVTDWKALYERAAQDLVIANEALAKAQAEVATLKAQREPAYA